MILATLWSFLIPSVDRSLYFHRGETKFTKNEKKIGNEKTSKENQDTIRNVMSTF